VSSVPCCWTEKTHLYVCIPRKNKQAEKRFSPFPKPTTFSSFIGWGFIWALGNTTDRTHRILYLTYLLNCLLLYCSEQSPSWATKRFLVKKLPAFYGTVSSLLPLQVPGTCPYLEPAHSSPCLQSNFLKIYLIFILPSMPLSYRWSISLRSPHQIPVFPIRATCRVHKISFDFMIRTIMGEQYRSLSASLFSFHHSPVTSSLLGPNILFRTLCSNTVSLHSCPAGMYKHPAYMGT